MQKLSKTVGWVGCWKGRKISTFGVSDVHGLTGNKRAQSQTRSIYRRAVYFMEEDCDSR